MNVTLAGKKLDIRLSRAAERALAARSIPLQVEMELLFSCLIRKRVHFGDVQTSDATPASEQLRVRFRSVMTHVCSLADVEGSPPLDDFPIANPTPFIPHWLDIDFRHGQWLGKFGY
jgi:hypothetical protein